MSDENTDQKSTEDSGTQNTPAPKPSPTPSPKVDPKVEDSKADDAKADPDLESVEELEDNSEAGDEVDQAYLDKHASLKNRDGEGAPGDMSGVFTSTENPGALEGDYSHETGRTQQAARDAEVTDSEK